MIILESEKNKEKLILLIGQGLIGSTIIQELYKLHLIRGVGKKPNWQDLDELFQLISGLFNFYDLKKIKNVDVVWSAGKAGFNSSSDETYYEYHIFENLINLITNLLIFQNDIALRIHLISSAGGLFEGMRNVKLETTPKPNRPYGYLKLKQEEYLQNRKQIFSFQIYRPSSLYGFIKKGQRLGLISTLISNLVNHRTSHIYGNYTTLRDYLLVDDLARFVAQKITSDKLEKSEVHFLASAQPTTIFEIQKLIEKVSKKKCYIYFGNSTNNAHITFTPHCIAKNFKANTLSYMIYRIYKAAMNNRSDLISF